jgi:hypothetical protein
MVPEVGIPSIDELVLSKVEGGQAHRHGVEAPRDFESENRLFANPLILKAVPLNHLEIQGENLSSLFHSTQSIPFYSGRFYHNSITVVHPRF